MQKTVLLVIVIALGGIFALGYFQARESPAPTPGEAARVHTTFANYRRAMNTCDGSLARQSVSESTISYYAKLRGSALWAPDSQLNSMTLYDQVTVLLLRYRVPAFHLREMTGADLFEHLVDQGWAGKGATALRIGKVKISGASASAPALKNGKPVGVDFSFVNEGGSWKLDLLPLLDFVEREMEAQLYKRGLSRDEFVRALVAAAD
jgi:hypothetical protein